MKYDQDAPLAIQQCCSVDVASQNDVDATRREAVSVAVHSGLTLTNAPELESVWCLWDDGLTSFELPCSRDRDSGARV